MAGGVAEVYTGMGTRFPLGSSNGALIGGLEDENGTTPGMECSGVNVVGCAGELLDWTKALVVE